MKGTERDGALEPEPEVDMLVIQYGGRTVKGYVEKGQWPLAEDLDLHLETPVFRPVGSDSMERIPLDGVKAIFWVKSFEGKSHEDLRFHDHLPAPECLWVRVTFHDGEVIEGLIGNNHNYVVHPGFYMSPIDPEGNNWLIYVLKSKLKEIQILGLRAAPKNMPRLQSAKALQAARVTA